MSSPAHTPTPQQDDPCAVDPKHYSVEYEDERIRIVRIRYGPHEKSVMHAHPAMAVTMLTGAMIRFTYPDGKSEEIEATAGQVMYMPPTVHAPENVRDTVFEAVGIELK